MLFEILLHRLVLLFEIVLHIDLFLFEIVLHRDLWVKRIESTSRQFLDTDKKKRERAHSCKYILKVCVSLLPKYLWARFLLGIGKFAEVLV